MYYSDYDIANPSDTPRWVGFIPPIKSLWSNPVSQCLYNPKKRRLRLSPRGLFILTFILSLALSVLFMAIGDEDTLVGLGFPVIILVSIPIALFALMITVFFTCFIGTSLRLREKLELGMIDSLLPTPLPDRSFFRGMIFPSIISGLRACENFIAFFFGAVLPFLVTMVLIGIELSAAVSLLDLGSGLLPAIVLWIIAAPILMVFHFTLASGLYSMLLPTSMAVPISIGHVALVYGFSVLMRMTYHTFLEMIGPVGAVGIFVGEMVQIAILIGLAVLTDKIGVMVFARYRRPGFYEPEWASAAGLMGR